MMPSINLEEYPKWICSVIENVNDDVKDTQLVRATANIRLRH
jgi:hypothetical protein